MKCTSAFLFSAVFSYGQKHISKPKKKDHEISYEDSIFLMPGKMKPLFFLRLVLNRKNQANYITLQNDFPEDWVTKSDVDTLMKLISSKEKCKCIVNPLSSYLPTSEKGNLGGYAIAFIKSFKEKKRIDFGLYSCPHTKEQDVLNLRKWWRMFP